MAGLRVVRKRCHFRSLRKKRTHTTGFEISVSYFVRINYVGNRFVWKSNPNGYVRLI